jgi:hypothetical protein
MAIDPKNQRQVDDTTTYIQDTLLSVSSKVGEALRDAVNEAFDGADATVIKSLGNDLTRTFRSAAKFSETIAQNNYKINQGLLSSRDIEKQRQALELKRAELLRKYLLARKQGIQYNLEDKQAALTAIDNQKRLLEEDEKRVKLVEQNMGSMGEIFTRLSKNKFFGSILNAEQGLIAMRKQASQGVSGFKLLGTGIKAAFAGIEKASVILFVLNQAVKVFRFFKDLAFGVSEQVANIGKAMGTSLETSRNVYRQLYDIQGATGGSLLNIERSVKALGELNSNFGYTRAVSEDLLKTQVLLTQRVGATADAASNFNLAVAATGGNAEVAFRNVVDLGRSMQEVDGIGIDVKTVMEDIASAGAEAASYFGFSTDELAKAVIETRKLGLNLTQAKSVAKGLLDFESSISAQLELSVLTQKQFNFGNAMAKAAMGDIAGATQDVIKQMNQLTAEQRRSPIILEAMSKATGLSTEELAKQYALQYDINAQKEEYGRILQNEGRIAALKYLTEKGIRLAEVQEITNRVSASEKFNEALMRAKDAFSQLVNGGLLDRLVAKLDVLIEFLDDFIFRAQQTSIFRAALGGGTSRGEFEEAATAAVGDAVSAYNLQNDKSIGLNRALSKMYRSGTLSTDNINSFILQSGADSEAIKDEVKRIQKGNSGLSASTEKQFKDVNIELIKTQKELIQLTKQIAENSGKPTEVNMDGAKVSDILRKGKTQKRQ